MKLTSRSTQQEREAFLQKGREALAKLPPMKISKNLGSSAPAPTSFAPLTGRTGRQVKWVWKDYIPQGMLTVLFGKGGIGKSTVAADLAARVSTGGKWPDGSPCAKGKVLLIELEDDMDAVLIPKLLAAGADLGNITVQNPGVDFRTLLEAASVELSKGGYTLVVLSPLAVLLPGGSQNDQSVVQPFLTSLQEMAQLHKVALLGLMHPRKMPTNSTGPGDLVEQLGGSSAWSTVSRMVLYLGVNTMTPPIPGQPLLLALGAVKANITSNQTCLHLRIVSATVELLDDTGAAVADTIGKAAYEPHTELEGMDAQTLTRPEDVREAPESLGAKKFLLGMLANGAQVPSVEIMRAARAAGLSDTTVQRVAKEEMGVIKTPARKGQPAIWSLPDPHVTLADLPEVKFYHPIVGIEPEEFT